MQPDNSFIKRLLKKRPKPKYTNWKLIFYIVLIIISLFICTFGQPAKDFIIMINEQLEELDWIGQLIIIGFLGLIGIPLGFPNLLILSILTLAYQSFVIPFQIAIISKFISSSLSYYFGRYALRRTFEAWLDKDKIFQCIEKFINDNPWKYSFLFKLAFLPFLIKNYGLALPHNMNYFIFTLTSVISETLISIIIICLAQQTKKLSDDYFNNDIDALWYSSISVTMLLLLLFYIIWKTIKLIKALYREDLVGRSSGLTIELDANINDDMSSLN